MTRSCSRARTTERGFALIAAIVLAVLYFGLIELLLLDSARELREAQRFRARIVALTNAENGAERAAADIANASPLPVLEDEQGTVGGAANYSPMDGTFRLVGDGTATGVVPDHARVDIEGKVSGNRVSIDYAYHSQ